MKDHAGTNGSDQDGREATRGVASERMVGVDAEEGADGHEDVEGSVAAADAVARVVAAVGPEVPAGAAGLGPGDELAGEPPGPFLEPEGEPINGELPRGLNRSIIQQSRDRPNRQVLLAIEL